MTLEELKTYLSTRLMSKGSRRQFIEQYQFSDGFRSKFATQSSLDASQVDLVLGALRQYFLLCLRAGSTTVSIPSRIVDDAWHEFILFTREYNDFCAKAFGRFLHHTPAQAMVSQDQLHAGMRRAWNLACREEGIDPTKPSRLPLLFSIDSQLQVPNGFVYGLGTMAAFAAMQNVQAAGAGSSGGCSSGGCGGDSGSSGGGQGDCGPGGGGDGCGDGGGGDGGGGCGGSSCGGSSCGGGGCGGGGCGGS